MTSKPPGEGGWCKIAGTFLAPSVPHQIQPECALPQPMLGNCALGSWRPGGTNCQPHLLGGGLWPLLSSLCLLFSILHPPPSFPFPSLLFDYIFNQRGQQRTRWLDLNGDEFKQAPGDGEGQGSLACYSPWDCKESDTTELLNNNITSNPKYSLFKHQ